MAEELTGAGLSTAQIISMLTLLRGFGEINNLPPPALDAILKRAEDEMLGRKPDVPGPPA